MKYPTLVYLALSAGSFASLAACGSSNLKAHRYDDMTSHRDRDYGIESEGEVLAACGLDGSRAYFAYDSSELTETDKRLLSDVSHCLTTGRLAGRSVLVTGYTDREGTPGYNLELGMARGRAVAMELAAYGVYQHHIYVRSHGEDRASGETSAGRALDRKVDLRIVARD